MIIPFKNIKKGYTLKIPSTRRGEIIPVEVISVETGEIIRYKGAKGATGTIVKDNFGTCNYTRYRSRPIDFKKIKIEDGKRRK